MVSITRIRLLAGGVAGLVLFSLADVGVLPLDPGTSASASAAQARERVLYVNVHHKSTHEPVADLGPPAFVVREDGRQREVLRVTRATSQMPIAVLVDNSQAATKAIPQLREGLGAFLREVEGVGPISLVTVADRPTSLSDYTTDTKALQNAAGRLFASPASGATLLDGISEVTKGLAKREYDRAAILVVSMENVEFSSLYYAQVLKALRDSGASLSAVVLTSARGGGTSDEQRSRGIVLDRGPRESGGVRFDVLTSMAFEGRLREVGRILKSQYRVVYARPESLIPPERIEVSMTNDTLEASAAPARGQDKK
jgi:hypothetical protein